MTALSAILDGPPGDGVAECLTLFDLCCCKRACRSMQAWADEAIELRGGVTRADVDAGVHARALHWLVSKSSQRRFTLAAGKYMLGDLEDPTHVYNARPSSYDDDSDAEDEWMNWQPQWRQGHGPLILSRPLTLVGNRDVTLTAMLNCSAVYVDSEPWSKGSGGTSLAVRLEGLNLGEEALSYPGNCQIDCLNVGPCSCQKTRPTSAPWRRPCSCTGSYDGPILTAHDCGFYSGMCFEGRVDVTGDSFIDIWQVDPFGRENLTRAASVKCPNPMCKGRLHPHPNGCDEHSAPPGCDCYEIAEPYLYLQPWPHF